MTRLRSQRRQHLVAWLALSAILLLSVVPTVSQILASRASHAGHATALAHAGSHEAMRHGDAEPAAKRPAHHPHGDDWRKCGYCDFLAHAPALAHLPYAAQFFISPAPTPVFDASWQRVRASYFLAAQPRGSPGVPA